MCRYCRIDGLQWTKEALAPGKYLIEMFASDPQRHTIWGFDTITLEGARWFGVHGMNMPGATPCSWGPKRVSAARTDYNCGLRGEVDERFKSHAWKACVG